MDRPHIIPVAQAPPQVVYAPAQNNCPYPIGPPSGHPAMPPLPLLRTRLDHDHNKARSNPELCRNNSASHVLSYDRRRPGRPNSNSNVSSEYNSHRRYNPAPISMPFPETALERRPGRPHSNSSVSTNRNSPIRYPPGPISMPFPETPLDRRIEYPEHRSYPPEPPPRTTSQLPPETPLQVEDHQFVRSMTLPSNYRARTAPSAPLASEENFSLADGNINHELPPPSYDDVMQEIRHERARSMINRR
ncbi:E3 ubiquitin-protein ligase Hakai-like [Diabrotica virgifera virgifera]|uniref:Uncharacterized protein n=1 Tax=Diabrotica virgifera virgifera TaxID=50390 RepID=A0ABM5I9N7_DIAVI|nr:E3 ubiquitin-protein ligase Hakai-like [Diabrotica virgifera virgifera]